MSDYQRSVDEMLRWLRLKVVASQGKRNTIRKMRLLRSTKLDSTPTTPTLSIKASNERTWRMGASSAGYAEITTCSVVVLEGT